MARRKRTTPEDLLAVTARLPPWASVGLAVIAYVLLRWVAALDVGSPSGVPVEASG